ncbi:MAG: FtsX-like permease family protein [Opitutus sp.]|nr:FtsX-like permease family protein [Opitutus sp.]MCS6246689.1 FtsX-like permease family protein [Opitutus sp.]MCS6272850.1 FtsX-like permease family protein [Opitutus sp.]MCS6278848.1 FtsX-like permease family protein [Opitutus sp.]MCS6299574.1 FtsX-like permease family protein [Opitutus sp.]
MNVPLLTFLLRHFTLRHWRLAPKQSALLVLILALGVSVFVAVRLANRAAVSSFANFTDTLTGQSDWVIESPTGSFPESVLPELRAALGSRPVHIIPLVEVTGATPPEATDTTKLGRTTYTLLGVDLLGVANLARAQDRSFFPSGNQAFWETFNRGPQIWISADYAPTPPTEIALVIDETIRVLPVAGLIPTAPDAPRAPATLMIADLAALQKISGKVGRIDRVEFVVEAGPRLEQRRAEVRDVLETLARPAPGAGETTRWTVAPPGARREAAEAMTRAFSLNLTILSLIALLTGLYLIFQALDGAVVRRRPEIAILRSLGVEERAIRRLWLVESALLGLAGGALGLVLGWAGAQLAVRAVAQTINALYYATTVASAQLTVAEIFLGLVLGVGAALVAGFWPAREAARTPPAQVLQRGARPAAGPRLGSNLALGLGFVAAGILCAQLPPLPLAGGGRFPLAGYAAAFLWIFGVGVVAAFLLPPLARLARGLGERSVSVKIALGHLRLPSGRHRLAAAALVCAIGMTAGMTILVASFEQTMQGWVKRALQADLYISSAGAQSASAQNRISAATANAIAEHPAVARSAVLIAHFIELDGIPTLLSGADLENPAVRPDLPWITAPRDDAMFDPARNAHLALVSESFTARFHVSVGDTLRLPTPAGVRPVMVAGVFADYGNERGSILMTRSQIQSWFAEDSVSNVALYVQPGIEPEALRAELLKRYPGLSIFTNAKLRAEVLRVFRQTFAITHALEVIGVAVAMTGLALTLISVLLDRRDELTTLRALGFQRQQIANAAAVEGLAVSACAVISGLALSVALGWLLIHVINKQSFGWTLSSAFPVGALLLLGAAVTVTGGLVGYAVGRWGADLPADREE